MGVGDRMSPAPPGSQGLGISGMEYPAAALLVSRGEGWAASDRGIELGEGVSRIHFPGLALSLVRLEVRVKVLSEAWALGEELQHILHHVLGHWWGEGGVGSFATRVSRSGSEVWDWGSEPLPPCGHGVGAGHLSQGVGRRQEGESPHCFTPTSIRPALE